MRARSTSRQARRLVGGLLSIVVTSALVSGCGGDEVQQQHLDTTFGSSNNCLFPVVDQTLDTSGPLKLSGGEPLRVQLDRRRETVDINATTLAITDDTPVTIVNVCLVPKIGRCILRFARAKVSTEPWSRRVAPSRPHDSWERARSYTIDPSANSGPVTLITAVGLALGSNKRHVCTGGAGGIGVVYRTDGVKRYAETAVDWTVKAKSHSRPSGKHTPKERSGSRDRHK